MSNVYGKIPISSGIRVFEDVGGSGLSGIVIGNESGLTCTVSLVGANVKKTLYPGTVDKFEVAKGKNWNGNIQIDPSSDLTNTANWPSSNVYIDTFGSNEVISGQYPFSLNRTGNIGNMVSTMSGNATGVTNDNNASGTVFVESTTLGSPTSNVNIDNSGTGWFGRWNSPTFTKIFQWFLAGTTAIKLAATGLLTEVLGGLTVDQNLTVVGSSSLDNGAITSDGAGNLTVNNLIQSGTPTFASLIVSGNENIGGALTVIGASSFDNGKLLTDGNGRPVIRNAVGYRSFDNAGVARTILWLDTLNVTQVQSGDSDAVQIDDHTGATMHQLDKNGIEMSFGRLTFPVTGSIKRIARFTGSATQTITHNWGEQADIVTPYYNGSFGVAPTQALAIKSEGVNSFTVVGQSGYSWTVLAIKF